MNNRNREEQFLELLDGTLSSKEQEDLLEAVRRDETLQTSLSLYSHISSLEELANSEQFTLGNNFADTVMCEISNQQSQGTAKEKSTWQWWDALQNFLCHSDFPIIRTSGALATLVIAILSFQMIHQDVISPQASQSQWGVSVDKNNFVLSTSDSQATDGMVDSIPQASRVDVVLTYSDQGKIRSEVIVPNARLVNSIGYSTLVTAEPSDDSTEIMMLDVTPGQSQSIQTAIEKGTVSFLYYG